MFEKLLNYYYGGKNWQHAFSGHINLVSAKIRNASLAQELEDACEKQHGMLTYAEYLHIEQFGENGYYAKSKHKGATDVHLRWGKPIALICEKYKYDRVIEFGCGNGNLGIEMVKEYNKLSKNLLTWTGIEINTAHHTEIKKKFTENNLLKNLGGVVTSFNQIKNKKKTLMVFAYSLDNIPPEIFTNIENSSCYPNALIGVIAKNGVLQETIIPEDILRKKGMDFSNGIFRNKEGQAFDLSSWTLRKGQRAYIATDAFSLVYEYTKHMPKKSLFIFIDEFRNSPFYFEAGILGVPKDLDSHSLECKNLKKYYTNAGQYNLYYPIYFDTFYRFLHTIGFQPIMTDIEQRMAIEMLGGELMNLRYRRFLTHAFIVSRKMPRQLSSLPLLFSPKRLL